MYTVLARNVRDALPKGLEFLLREGVREESRAGPVLVSPVPVSTVYTHPCERVLLSPVRDANPFFHLAEALWMLAGRRDTAFLDNFVSDFGKRFGEPGGTMHGAYGHRWRHALGYDQLDVVVEKLRANPADRQAVIQMWDGRDEHSNDDMEFADVGENDLRGTWRDRPCNTQAYLRVRDVKNATYQSQDDADRPEVPGKLLDMMVTCRSNDIIMGAYGANAVHFSILLEYLAARIGVAPGTYTQVSWNFHAYERDLERLVERARGYAYASAKMHELHTMLGRDEGNFPHTRPLVTDPETFDGEVRYLLNLYESLGEGPADQSAHDNIDKLTNPFLSCTVWPMLMAHRCWRLKSQAWRHWLSGATVEAAWRTAGAEWIQRRVK